MPETVGQLGQKVKAKYPGVYDDIEDMELGRRVKAKYPGSYDDFTEGESPDPRTALQVGLDQTSNVIMGPYKAVMALPSVAGELAGATAEALTGKGSTRGQNLIKSATANVFQPTRTVTRGLAALGSPNRVEAPTDTEWIQAAEGAGINLAGLLTGGTPAAIAKIKKLRALDPDNLMMSGATLRSAGPSIANAADFAADAVGVMSPRAAFAMRAGGRATATVAQPVLNMMARVMEETAKWRAKGAKAPAVPDAATMFRGEPFTPPTPQVDQPFQYADAQARASRAQQERLPIPQEPIERTPLSPASEQTPPYRQPLPYEAQPPEPGPFFANMKPPAERGPDLPVSETVVMEVLPAKTPATIKKLEEAIAPSGDLKKVSVLRIGERLLEIAPELANIPKGPMFDAKLMEAFKRVEQGVIAADDAIPANVPVKTSGIVEKIINIADEYEGYGNQKTAAQIMKEAEKWSDLPETINWQDFRNRKRAFFNDHKIASGPMRRIYGILMEASEEFSKSEALKAANLAYSTVRRGIEAAKIDLKTGRRIANVGKAAEQMQEKFTQSIRRLPGGPL